MPNPERHVEVDVGGLTRAAIVHVPENVTSASPIVVALHGAGQSAVYMETATGLSTKAEESGFVAVYPEAEGADWDLVGRRDVEYVAAVLREVRGPTCSDEATTFAVGYSRGGGLAHRLACDPNTSLSGMVSIAGMYVSDAIDSCSPTRAVPVLAVHGSADAIVPYEGGESPDPAFELAPVEAWAQSWATANGCAAEPSRQDTATEEVAVLSWQGCESPVVLHVVSGGSHAWYGGPMEAAPAPLDATRLVTEFVSRWSDG